MNYFLYTLTRCLLLRRYWAPAIDAAADLSSGEEGARERAAQLSRLADSAVPALWLAGEGVYSAGQAATHLFVVLAGAFVEVAADVEQHRFTRGATMGVRDGRSRAGAAAASRGTYAAPARAASDARALALPVAALWEAPSVCMHLFQRLCTPAPREALVAA